MQSASIMKNNNKLETSMRLPKSLRVGKLIQKLTNISLATILSLSGLAGSVPLFLSQTAYADSHVVINELLPHPSTGSEWVELYNPTGQTVDLTGWQLKDAANNTFGTMPASIAIGSYAIITDANVLNNSGTETVTLLDSANAVQDSVSYNGADIAADASFGRITDGSASMTQFAYPTQASANNTYFVSASGNDSTGNGSQASPFATLNKGISAALAGGTVNLVGAVAVTTTVSIDKPLTLTGSNAATIDATGVSSGYGVYTNVDGVTIANLSILGPTNSTGYGLKIEGSAQNPLAADSDIHITNVSVTGSYRTAIDLNGINDAVLTNVSASGTSHGNGIAVTDSRNITINGVTTSGNAWGGIALYATGNFYSCGVDNVAISNLSSDEISAVYTGIDNSSDPTCTITNLSLPTYNLPYKVALSNDDPQDVYVTSLANAGVLAGLTTPLNPIVRSTADNSLWVAPGQTLSAAVANAKAGDTINLPAGDYSSEGTIDLSQPVSLRGPQAGVVAADTTTGAQRGGSEATVSDLSITSNDVSVDGLSFSNAGLQINVTSPTTLTGLTLKNNIFNGYDGTALTAYDAGNVLIENNLFTSPSGSSEAIQLRASVVAGGCDGSQVLNNVFSGATTNGAADVNLSCTASNSSNIVVSGNRSTGNSGGSSFIALSGVAGDIQIADNLATTTGSTVFFFGDVSGTAAITGNTFSGGSGTAISIHGGDIIASDVVNTGNFIITNNDLSGNSRGISVASNSLSGSLVAHGNNLSGNTDLAVANGSSITLDTTGNWWGQALGPTSSQFTGDVDVSSWCSLADCSASQSASGGSTSLPAGPLGSPTPGVGEASLTLPDTNDVVASVNTTFGTVSVTVAKGTTITAADANWDGSVMPPTISSLDASLINTAGYTTTVQTVIAIGSNDFSLSFDHAARILLTGQAGQRVGFVPAGGNFTEINRACTADNQTAADLLLNGSGECKMTVGSDLVVWTTHFTKFVTYSQTAVPGSTGGSNSTSSSSSSATGSSTSGSTQTASGTTSDQTEVLGATTEPSGSTKTAALSASTTPAVASVASPSKTGKVFGLKWYLWLIGLAVLAAAGYFVYRLADTTDRSID